jgi:FtsH-binding integral membrane protein
MGKSEVKTMAVKRRRNPEFIMFIIGVGIMLVFLVLVLFRGQQIKNEEVVQRSQQYAEWHNWRD